MSFHFRAKVANTQVARQGRIVPGHPKYTTSSDKCQGKFLVHFDIYRLDFQHFRENFGIGYYLSYELLKHFELFVFVHASNIGMILE